jgi:Leucine-rich repeat (LRR) protein
MEDKPFDIVVSALLQKNSRLTIDEIGSDCFISAALLPTTRLSPSAVAILPDFSSSLQALELVGDGFPTTQIEPSELSPVTKTTSLTSLSVHGAYLTEEMLIKALATLRKLSDLGLQGTRLSEKSLEALLPSLPLLRQVRVGLAAPKAMNHRFTPASFGVGTLNLLDTLPCLTGVSLRGIQVSDEILAMHSFLDQILRLDIGETLAADSTAIRLAKNPRIHSLALDRTRLTDSGLTVLSASPTLQCLSVAHTRISDAGVLSLRNTRGLQELDLSGNTLRADSLEALSSLVSLERFALRGVSSAAEALKELSLSLKRLRELELDDASPLGASQLSALASIATLERASLAIDPSDAHAWKALSHLNVSLALSAPEPPPDAQLPSAIDRYTLSGTISSTGFNQIASCPFLKRLDMDGGGGGLFGDVELTDFPSLRELIGQDISLTDKSLDRLAKCPRLEALYISGNPITDHGVATLGHSPWINTLELRDTKITDASIAVLLSLPRLHCLDVPGTLVTDVGVSQLADAPNLQSLALDGHQVTDRSVEGLSQKLTLVEIYLYGREITPAVIRKLTRLPQLAELVLNNVALGMDAAEAIAACPSLRIVRLGGQFPAALPGALRRLRPDLTVDGGHSFASGRVTPNEPPEKSATLRRVTRER